MSDSLEPPAKKARLEADAPGYGFAAALDAPGSPVDDMDDDFYDTSPVKPAAQPLGDGSASLFASAPPTVGFQLPGLGALGAPPAALTVHEGVAARAGNDTSEDGEVSESDAFYAEEGAAPANSNQQVEKPSTTELSAKPVDHALIPDNLAPTDHANAEAAPATTLPSPPLPESIAAETSHVSDARPESGKAEFLQAAEANKDDKNAEWQADSEASDSDSSSDSSSDGEAADDGSDDGELLDPEEQVRRLLAEALDEPDAPSSVKVKTVNEVDEQYEKPNIEVTEEMAITELGKVERVVANVVVIKGKSSGVESVLESGSVLCLQNRTVVGKVSEQIGRVEEPRYSLGFADPAEITTLGIAENTPIFYVNAHSTFVITELLRREKHTDASNIYDEEVNEVEFSDDEVEAAYKLEKKHAKRMRNDPDHVPDSSAQPEPPAAAKASRDFDFPANVPTGPRAQFATPASYQSTEYQGGGLKYSDDEDEDLGMYKPLARPEHYEQIITQGAPTEDRSHTRRGGMRGRGAWPDRGRGSRGRAGFGGGFGGRGDHGGGRGGFAGRGDFSGRGGPSQRGDRSGSGGGRADNRGGRGGPKGQADQGRHRDQSHDEQRNTPKPGQQGGNRPVSSASPARQFDRGQPPTQPQAHSAPGQGKKNRKQRKREARELQSRKKREQSALTQQQSQAKQQQQKQQGGAPSATTNGAAYANNKSSTPSWPASFTPATQTPAPAPLPTTATVPYASSYVQPPQAPSPAPAATPAPAPAQDASNVAAWAQWFQMVGVMQRQQQQQPPAQPPQQHIPQPVYAQPTPPPVQPAPYTYPQQQYGQQQYSQQPAPAANPQQQANAQSAQTLQDILRALGAGAGAGGGWNSHA